MKLPVPVNGAFVAYGAVGYGVAPGDAFTGGQLVPRRRAAAISSAKPPSPKSSSQRRPAGASRIRTVSTA